MSAEWSTIAAGRPRFLSNMRTPVEQDLGREYLWRGQRLVRSALVVSTVLAALLVVSPVTVIPWSQIADIEVVVRQEPRWRYCIARTRSGEQLRLPGVLSADVADLVATARLH